MSWPRRILQVSNGAVATSDRLAGDVVATLVARAKRGDGEAFGALYDHYVGQVYAFVAVRLAGQPDRLRHCDTFRASPSGEMKGTTETASRGPLGKGE